MSRLVFHGGDKLVVLLIVCVLVSACTQTLTKPTATPTPTPIQPTATSTLMIPPGYILGGVSLFYKPGTSHEVLVEVYTYSSPTKTFWGLTIGIEVTLIQGKTVGTIPPNVADWQVGYRGQYKVHATFGIDLSRGTSAIIPLTLSVERISQ